MSILCALADAATSVAFAGVLEEGESFVTLQLSATYLHSVQEGRLVATAGFSKRGGPPDTPRSWTPKAASSPASPAPA